MNSFEVYQNYIAIKLHFAKWEYDYFLFRGQTNVSVKAYERRKDHVWFKKLANLHSPIERIVAHVSYYEGAFIRDIVQDTDDIFRDWQIRNDTLTDTFKREIKRLKAVFNDNFLFTPGSHPYLVREYLGGRISLETITIISELTDCVSYWGEHMDDDPLFENVIRRIMKYAPFLKFDVEKFRKILLENVEEH